MIKIKEVLTIFKTAFIEWMSKDPFRESAVIAYYAIFSLPGLLVVVVYFAGYFFGRDVVNEHITLQITSTMGADTANQIKEMTSKASKIQGSFWATMAGIITIFVGATAVFVQFQQSLNIIWEVKADQSKSGWWSLVRARLFSMGLIVSIGFILIVSLVVSTMLSAFGTWLSERFPPSMLVILQIANFIFSLLIISVLFALMFKFLPDAKIKWSHVWVGAILTSFLFDLGKMGLGLYFGQAKPGSGYGAAGSITLIMLWVSYSSMIVFYGAEFTRAYAEWKDGTIQPDKNAVKVQNESKGIR